MTPAEAQQAFEAQFQHVVSLIHENDSFAPNGKKFEVLAPGLAKKKGVTSVPPFPDASVASEKWLEAATAARGAATILYWRINPHITTVPGGVTCVSSMAFGVDGDPLSNEVGDV